MMMDDESKPMAIAGDQSARLPTGERTPEQQLLQQEGEEEVVPVVDEDAEAAITQVITSSMAPLRLQPQHLATPNAHFRLTSPPATPESASKRRARLNKDKIVFREADVGTQQSSLYKRGASQRSEGRRSSSFSSLFSFPFSPSQLQQSQHRKSDSAEELQPTTVNVEASPVFIQHVPLGARSSSTSPQQPLDVVSSTSPKMRPRRHAITYTMVDPTAECDRFSSWINAGTDADDEGGCDCDFGTITKDVRGIDYSGYHAHTLFHMCAACGRRPGLFLCVHCMTSFCPSHVESHTRDAAVPQCFLYISTLDITTCFDRIFWCEKCRRFTWKFTDEFQPLTDQIVYTKGTYLDDPVTDVWLTQYSVTFDWKQLVEAHHSHQFPSENDVLSGDDNDDAVFLVESWDTSSPKSRVRQVKMTRKLCALGASSQGWRSAQEDAEAVFAIQLPDSSLVGATLDTSCAVFCVFDGHGGDAVAKIAARDIQHFLFEAFAEAPPLAQTQHERVSHTFSSESRDASMIVQYFTKIFEQALLNLDAAIQNSPEGLRGDFNCVGCTACIVAITEDFFACANVGDSGAVLFHTADMKQRRLSSQDPTQPQPPGVTTAPISTEVSMPFVITCKPSAVFTAPSPSSSPRLTALDPHAQPTIAVIPLSRAHRLADEKETARVRSAGYSISDNRIEGMLAVPRALGDYDFKQCGGKDVRQQAVSPVPDVVVVPRKRRQGRSELLGEVDEEKDWVVLLACDGVWDTMKREDVCKIVHAHVNARTRRRLSLPPGGSASPQSTNLSFSPSVSSLSPGCGVLPPQELDAQMLSAANAVFDRCLAGSIESNEDGLGLDNMSLLIVRPAPTT